MGKPQGRSGAEGVRGKCGPEPLLGFSQEMQDRLSRLGLTRVPGCKCCLYLSGTWSWGVRLGV